MSVVQVAGYGAPFWAVGGVLLCLVPLTSLLVKETSEDSMQHHVCIAIADSKALTHYTKQVLLLELFHFE